MSEVLPDPTPLPKVELELLGAVALRPYEIVAAQLANTQPAISSVLINSPASDIVPPLVVCQAVVEQARRQLYPRISPVSLPLLGEVGNAYLFKASEKRKRELYRLWSQEVQDTQPALYEYLYSKEERPLRISMLMYRVLQVRLSKDLGKAKLN